MDGVNGEQQCAEKTDAPISEETAANIEDQHNNCGVHDDAKKMKAKGNGAKKLPEKQEAEGHQRAIVVGGTGLADKGPYGSGENLREKVPAFYVGILENLLVVVVDEAIAQDIEIADQAGEQ